VEKEAGRYGANATCLRSFGDGTSPLPPKRTRLTALRYIGGGSLIFTPEK